MIVTENQLDEWVRGNAREAQGVIVELVWRLVAASSPKPKERRFPLGDSIGQPGADGFLNTDVAFDPFIPEGKSFWEIGTGNDAGDKATTDYRNLTAAVPESVRHESTFVFVTPLSGRRDWPYTWKEDAIARWLEERRRLNEWRDVRVIDGTGLIDWLHHFPAVEQWLTDVMRLPAHHMQTVDHRWAELRVIGDPPPLIPDVFLANREAACSKLREMFSGTIVQLRLDTYFPDQMADFVSAYIATMEQDARLDITGRCLVITGPDSWNAIPILREPHILIADFDLDDANSGGTRLLERARRAGHAVIYGGLPGGIPHPHRVSIPSPKSYQIREALEKAGYKKERARVLAQKSNGNLSSLLRCLQNLSLIPEWAQGTDAAELVIAELLGSWTEQSEADKLIAEKLSKKAYGEWIGNLREILHRPGTPLIQHDGVWKMVLRYEGWYALGPKLFDEHLDRLRETTISVLREKDPQFELAPNERFAASIHGKNLTHSNFLRNGLAESLALLGSHPRALTSCSTGKAEATAVLTVREVLNAADWVLWASLNYQLPLLAEAAPGEFLNAVEKALNSAPCPFDTIFTQEGDGIFGGTYMTGLLWALETLAWDAEYLIRVVVILGELAARDPGGKWANRPANSLSTILLPWLPQTCAPIPKRKAAVETLLKEVPNIAWKLLLAVLPSMHQTTSGSHKPTWREIIPDDWSTNATGPEYSEQISAYAELAITAAKQDVSKLTELIERIPDLLSLAGDQLLAHLRSDTVVSLPQTERFRLWSELIDLVTKHRRYADAQWAMNPNVVNEIEAVAERLAPDAIYRHQRLFSERDFELYEEKGNYEDQREELDNRREKAVNEVLAARGQEGVLEFAKVVQSPWRVGFALGTVAGKDVDKEILPALLESETKSLEQLAGGFVWERFRGKGWAWVDTIDTVTWSPSQKGQFLAYLPFTPDTWQRSVQLLGLDERPYWSKASVNPYQIEKGLELAIDRLIQYDRPYAAIMCLEKKVEGEEDLDTKLAVRALRAASNSPEDPRSINVNSIIEVIKALQENPNTDLSELFQIEWEYLPLLDRDRGASPKLLEQKLADDPIFFCEVIRLVFRSDKEESPVEELSEQQKQIAKSAYRLLTHWKTPPGCQKDDTFNGDALTTWLEKVKAACMESGHLGTALSRIGHVLAYTPHDPDGLWLHQSAAIALNAKDVDDMRRGLTTELFNRRGVHGFTAGTEERQLAEKYRKQADEVEARGYHRLATSLRGLAASYERDAERDVLRDSVDL